VFDVSLANEAAGGIYLAIPPIGRGFPCIFLREHPCRDGNFVRAARRRMVYASSGMVGNVPATIGADGRPNHFSITVA
jgi:hypothetical protein